MSIDSFIGSWSCRQCAPKKENAPTLSHGSWGIARLECYVSIQVARTVAESSWRRNYPEVVQRFRVAGTFASSWAQKSLTESRTQWAARGVAQSSLSLLFELPKAATGGLPGLHKTESSAIQDALNNLRVLEREERRMAAEDKKRILQQTVQTLKTIAPKFQEPDQAIALTTQI